MIKQDKNIAEISGSNSRSSSRSLPIMLLRTREQVLSPFREMLSNEDITEQQWRVLRVLSEYGELDSKDAAEQAVLLMPSMTRIAQTLEQKGMITRRSHEQDRRRVLLSITPIGQKIIDDNLPKSQSIMTRIRDKYGQEKLDKLIDLLNDLNKIKI